MIESVSRQELLTTRIEQKFSANIKVKLERMLFKIRKGDM